MLIDELREALGNRYLRAFLHVIRVGEGTPDERGYQRMFGGSHFDSFSDHPRKRIRASLGGTPITSTAAGAYQFLSTTWDECAKALSLSDFSPQSQDVAAVYLIRRRGALADALAGRIEAAITKCNREWASLPGSPYGQPVKTMAQALATYHQALQAMGDDPAPEPTEPPPDQQAPEVPPVIVDTSPIQQERPMVAPILPAILSAVLPEIVKAIPKLGRIFGSGSAVAERNIKAAETVVEIVTGAVGAKNAQEAVEIIRSDPTAARVADDAVAARWHDLTEVGGGIDAARKADAAMVNTDGPWWQFLRSPSFWFLVLMVPPVYAIIGSVVGLWGGTWPADVRAAIATAVVSLIIGGGAGYYWGQTTSRNRTQSTQT